MSETSHYIHSPRIPRNACVERLADALLSRETQAYLVNALRSVGVHVSDFMEEEDG